MSAESFQTPKPGETVLPNGFILPPERNSNVRDEPIQFKNLGERSTKYNSPGVDPSNPYNAFARSSEIKANQNTAEVEAQPQSPERTAEAHLDVMEGLVSELEQLRNSNKVLEEKINALEQRLASQPEAKKELAEKQPRRVRSENGVTERLVKFADGTFEWQPIGEKESEAEADPTDEKIETAADEKSEKQDTGMEIKIGDRVRYTDRNGNVVEGVLESTTALDNEDYVIYHVRTDEGELKPVSYAELSQIATVVQPEGDEKSGTEKIGIVELPDDDEVGNDDDVEKAEEAGLDFGKYPELYAQRKNLASGEKTQNELEAEGKKVAENMAGYVSGKMAEFMEKNPEATEDEIKQAAMGFYLEAKNGLEREIIEHIDGLKVEGKEAKGRKGLLRRFGAWMDRHGDKIKKGLLIAGAVGLAATGIGLAATGATVGFALSAGTLLGAVKGAGAGALWQRHGSKNSEARKVSLDSKEAKEVSANLNPADRKTFDAVSQWLMSQYDVAAGKDHSKNVKRTRTAVLVGGAIGAVAGSLQIETPISQEVTTTDEVPNTTPEIISHQIAPGELTGQVLDKLLADNNINLAEFLQANNITGYGDSFTMADGSTNIALLHAIEGLGADFGIVGEVHSFAGADALSNDGIRSIYEAIHNNVDWGSESVDMTTTETGREVNLPLTALAAGAASLVGDGVTKMIADRTARNRNNTQRVEVEG